MLESRIRFYNIRAETGIFDRIGDTIDGSAARPALLPQN